MQVPDINVLVALALGTHPHHELALAWWKEIIQDGEPFVVPDFVAAGFVRVATNRSVSGGALGFADAFHFLERLRNAPTYLHWRGSAEIIAIFEQVVREANPPTRLTSDAYIAACAISVGGTLVTLDRDFRRFDGLRRRELV